jgi:hypothetical protein
VANGAANRPEGTRSAAKGTNEEERGDAALPKFSEAWRSVRADVRSRPPVRLAKPAAAERRLRMTGLGWEAGRDQKGAVPL